MKQRRVSVLVTLLSVVLACATARGAVEEVIVVFKTHFDIGYTDLASNVVERYRTVMMDQALAVAEQNRNAAPAEQFVWTIPGWPMKKIQEEWAGQTRQRKERVQRAFDEGRFAVHALPFTTHTELLEAEDLVRGMVFSSGLSRAAGKALPRDAKMTDVPSHSWILPTLLKHAGVDFLHLGCNPASSSPVVPLLFWWEGPDGSRILTMYSAREYGGGLVPPADWPHRTWLAAIMTGDNHGPPRPDEVRQVIEEGNQKLPGVKVRIGRLSDFYDALMAETPNLPVVRGDMSDTWIYGPMSNPEGVRLVRHLRPALATAECLGTELSAWGVRVPVAERRRIVADAYEQSLLYGEHTWGGSIPWIYGRYMLRFGEEWKRDREAGKFQRIEASWAEHTAYATNALGLVRPLLQAEMSALAEAVEISGPRVVVFNPLPWARSGPVSIAWGGKERTLKDGQTGKVVPAAVEAGGNGLRFVAVDVPPCGYRTFSLQSAGKVETAPLLVGTNNTMENRFFRLRLDGAHGTVQSWIDKRSGRELVDASAPQGFGQYLYERFDRDQVEAFVKAYVKISAEWATNELGKPSLPPASECAYRGVSPRGVQVRYEQTAVSVTAVMEAAADSQLRHAVTTRVTLYADQPWVELEVEVHEKPFDAWPEAGWICLPFKVADPTFRLARLGAVVDPARDIVAGCNFDQYALNGGLTVTDRGGIGVGMCAEDSPLVSLGEPGCWKYSKVYSPRKARVFVNLFNNQWSTNFRLWNSGTWSSRIRLWPVESADVERALVTPSEETRFPLEAVAVAGPGGKLTASQAGLQLSRRGVKVTAFGPNPDGDGLILRLWEQAGRGEPCRVMLPAGLKAASVQPVDLRGRPSGPPVAVSGGWFEVAVRPYAPVSYRVEAPGE